MEVFFFTLGCKVNQYETVLLKNIFLKENFNISKNPESADIFIINSCTVTSSSDRKVNKLINKIKNIKKNSIIILTGCLPQAFPKNNIIFNKVDITVGNTNKFELPKILKKYIKNKEKLIKITNFEPYNSFDKFTIEKVFKTPRAFLKIQDGCNRYCSYCIIPKARNILKSKSLEKIKLEAENISNNGCCEIVLTGINLSYYGNDLENVNLIDVVKTISKIKNIKRIRFSSLAPNFFNEENFLELAKEEKFCPQFHFSLQSGSNSVLKRMGRFYNKEEYIKTVNSIFKIFNNPSITTDIIVGFPGETETEFEETLNFVKKIGFFKIHIFPYSKREGTKAATMQNQITNEKKKQRVKILQILANKENLKFLNNQKEKILQVLFETKKENLYIGYSKNYCPIKIYCKDNIIGKIKRVKIKNVVKNYLTGEVLN